jgi:hypothetical protein
MWADPASPEEGGRSVGTRAIREAEAAATEPHMLGFDGRRLGPCRPEPVFPLIGVNKGNLYMGKIANQMMYLQRPSPTPNQ